jgi:predicted RNA-binding Zn ribbon-like protein
VNTGQWFLSSEGNQWWFDSGALCLDFAYTGSMGDNPAWEQFHQPAELGGWLAGRFERVNTEATERELIDGIALRAAIAGLAKATSAHRPPNGDDIDTINLFAATPNIPPSLAGGSRQAGRSAVRVGQALATIARNAVELFRDDTGRLRACSAENCGLIFYDESRSNNRRWCSMQRCGNRSKVRAHRARSAA